MDKRAKIALIGSLAALLIIVIALGAVIVEKLTPGKEYVQLSDYYDVKDTEAIIILQDSIYEKKGLVSNGIVYIDMETVLQEFNHRFYWDSKEYILTYTTPDEIIRMEAGEEKYSVTKSMIETEVRSEYPLVIAQGETIYVALDFIGQYSDMSYHIYTEPNRVVINNEWGEFLFTSVTKETQLREGANIKSRILKQLPVGTELRYVMNDEAPKGGFIKVMTSDGIIGYIKEKHTKESYYLEITSDYQEPVYTAQTRSGKINMVFHQVFNVDAVNHLESLIKATKEVNVISPTWFSITDNSGQISSIASAQYVEKAKELGLEVWALVDDFNQEVNMLELLSSTTARDNLSNALLEAALEYKLNGINIDFENISKDAGKHYIQFLRELSVKCRNNGIVLSVDSYVPTAYTAHYDREEQGKIVDYVVVMAYDEHYAGSEVAGPVASLSFVRDAVNNILTMVPKEKTIIAIPFYTRLWKEAEDGTVTSESLSMTPAAEVIANCGVEAEWDEEVGSYYVEYKKDGALYRMWQEEERSIEEKMKIIADADVAGVAAWKLGLEKEVIWNVIISYLK